jgi:hypothetical protein
LARQGSLRASRISTSTIVTNIATTKAASAPHTNPRNHESLDIPTSFPALQNNTAIAINQHLATDRTTNMSATAQAPTSNLFHNTVPAEEE